MRSVPMKRSICRISHRLVERAEEWRRVLGKDHAEARPNEVVHTHLDHASGTMGRVVHEPWPLIASKHALRIILADSRQTFSQDERTQQRNRTDETW
ncbi:hypothetical protein K0M31_012953 [Melipona bicolor]|uniref:Uncharacterized protein n=1 Tax=Melipona bicolor TaxID=60889 RepID=A0AA40KGZ2_9HYME|nr:hypothetical protein K0M31_012953 [Melipona bicolor]